MTLKIIFAGTPAFAAPTLKTLLSSAHNVCAVFTQPDRPAGRGKKLTASVIKEIALQHQLPIYQPLNLRDEITQQQIKNLHADVMIVVAYGLIIPAAILAMPKMGCINVHASLLPRWRGAAPIQRAILAGDEATGITIMQMNAGLDTGDILTQSSCPITATDTSATLQEKLAQQGATDLLTTLDDLVAGKIKPQPQDNSLATYASKITKAEAKINWQLPAITIERAVRAFNPWPVAYTEIDAQPLRIWQATALPENNTINAGTILHADEHGIDIATGEGVLRILQLQLPGSRVMSVADVLHSKKSLFKEGTLLS